MVTLNDYLYSGATVFRILKKYTQDLRTSAKVSKNEVDLVHCNFLIQIMELLEHNDFLTAQSQKIREFYKYMAMEYPYLSFTFKGRIKSLIRAEGKFNGYIVEYIYDYYKKHKSYPDIAELKEKLNCFRDLIAYRIVISMPRCHLKNHENREEEELKHLYQIANVLPQFLEERGFTAEPTGGVLGSSSPLLDDAVKPYYRDYITSEKEDDYKSLHITFYDNSARCYVEMQLRTKQMEILQKSVPPIILIMRKSRKHPEHAGIPSRRENAFILMKLMNGAGVCRNWSFPVWMSTCLQQ